MPIILTTTAVMEKNKQKTATPNKNDKTKTCKYMTPNHLKKDNKASGDFWSS